MRTQDEIRARYDATRDEDPLGFRAEVLLPRLDYAHVADLVKPDTTEAEWADGAEGSDAESVLDAARDYMAFAWGKVADHRGISAGRSVEKIGEYLWLAEETGALAALEEAGYAQYGAPKLLAVCQALGWPWPADDPGVVRMSEGLPCEPGCVEGCGT